MSARWKMKPETRFEKDLASTAQLLGCQYIKIPDPKCINKNNRYSHHEDKRPFDGILCTPRRNWLVECKINYNTLSEHQAQNEISINEINGSFIVLRKKIIAKKNMLPKSLYVIEQKGLSVYDTEDLLELVKYIKLSL